MLQIKKPFIASLFAALIQSLCSAGTIVIDNQAHTDIWFAPYHSYTSRNYALRAFDPVKVSCKQEVSSALPRLKPIISNRMIFFDEEKENLTQRIELSSYTPAIQPYDAGLMKSKQVSIVSVDGVTIAREQSKADRQARREILRTQLEQNSSHAHKSAHVVTAPGLDEYERAYLAQRKKLAKKALEKALGKKVFSAHVPRIGVCASGGGFRAVLSSVGVYKGFSEIGLLDSISSAAGVSGGAWGLLTWAAEKCSIDDLYTRMQDRFTDGIMQPARKQYDHYLSNQKHEQALGRPFGVVDWFGATIKHILLPSHRHEGCQLSTLKTEAPHHMPFPIATAITRKRLSSNYQWVEMTPSSTTLLTKDKRYRIPSWALGRSFKNGSSTNTAPEFALSKIIGTCGSAFSISIKDILDRTPQWLDKVIPTSWKDKIYSSRWGKSNFSPALFPNFVNGISGAFNADKSWLMLIDSGLDLNIPVNPFLRKERHQDLIIIINAGFFPDLIPPLLKRTYMRLQEHFPHIGSFELEKACDQGAVTFFHSPAKDTPNILHICLKKDDGFDPDFEPLETSWCHVTNFHYTKEQALKLMGLLRYTIVKNKDIVLAAIQTTINDKKEHSSVFDVISQGIKSLLS